MTFVRFDKDCGKVKIWQETSSEDGWVFTQDEASKKFHVWENAEVEAQGKCPDETFSTLEEVFNHVSALT